MPHPVLVARAGDLATVTLNRPEKLNALDLAMWRALQDALVAVAADPGIRCVVVSGAGTAFAAGADLAEFAAERASVAAARRYSATMNGALAALRDLPQPSIAAIRGACVGAGLEIAILCDLRIAAQSGRFGVPIQRLGVTMPYPEIAYLVDLVGRATALEILLEGRVFDALEALRMRLVGRVVTDDALDGEVSAAARRIAEGAPLAHRWHKQATRRAADPRPWSEVEIAAGFAAVDSADYREGIRAFLAKKKPRFEGR